MPDLRQGPWTQFNITNRAEYGLYLLDDAANQLRLFRFDGTEITSRRIQLASRSWRGAFGNPTDRYITLLDTDWYRYFDLQNQEEVENKVLRLPSGTWLAALTHYDFFDNRSNQLRAFFTRPDYDNEGRFVLEELSDYSTQLPARNWKGVSMGGYIVYLIESSGSTDKLHEYDDDAIAFPDQSPYNLPSGVWGLCIEYGLHDNAIQPGKIYILEVNTRRIRVFRFEYDLDGDVTFAEITSEAFTLPTGTWRDGFVYQV